MNLRSGLWANRNARVLLVVGLVDSAGNGAYVSTAVVLFAAVLHLSASQIGAGLALGGLLGLVFLVPVGVLADRVGTRRALLGIQIWRALGSTAYVFVHNFTGYLVVVGLLSIAEQASPPTLLSFVSSALGESDRVKAAAALQSIRNAGFTIGALLGSLALLSTGRTALNAVVLGNAVTFVFAATLLARVKLVAEPVQAASDAARSPARPRTRPAFLAMVAVSGILNLHPSILEVGLPLWVVTRALAPKSIVSVLIAINTVMVVLLQVRLSRGTETARSSSRLLRRAGAMLLAATVLLAVSDPVSSATVAGTVAVLVVATVALTFGEMWQTSGAWGVSLALSPPAARGRFLAAFNVGPSVRTICGPLLVSAWVVGSGPAGWVALGVLLALTGLLAPTVARLAEHEYARHERLGEPVPEVVVPGTTTVPTSGA